MNIKNSSLPQKSSKITQKKIFLIISTFLVLSLGSLYYWTEITKSNQSYKPLFEKGSTFPNSNWIDLSGNKRSPQDFKNQIVLVNFWATWCSPCIEEIPSLIKLVKEFKGHLVLFAISADSTVEEIETFKKSFPDLSHENIFLIWDKDKSIMKEFKISKLPESLVLNKNNIIIKKVSGTINWFTEDSKQYFSDLLK